MNRIRTYREFWPYYLREHSHPRTRRLHVAGTLCGLATALGLGVSGRWTLLPLALIPGYAFAWFAHFRVERNKPATFRYPLWSFVSDFRMAFLWLTGRLEPSKKSDSPRKPQDRK